MAAARPKQAEDIKEWPIYWFGRFEKAIEVGDLPLATKARSRLLSLGYDVKTRSQRKIRTVRS